MSKQNATVQTVRCIVAGSGGNGPVLLPVRAVVTDDEYDVGVHYDLARELASEHGLSETLVVFDQYDGAAVGDVDLFDISSVDWDATPVMTSDPL